MRAQKKFATYDVISIGEAGLDTFVKIDEASLLCNIDRDNCLMCLRYGDKITIESLQETLAHNGCNFAVGTARLGLRVALYANIGDDEVGKKVLAKLAKEGVCDEYVAVTRKKASNHSIVLNYKAERTILVHRQPHTYRLPKLKKSTWIYLTSLGNGFQKLHVQLLSQIKANGFKLAFNPGDVQLRAGVKALMPILEVCSLLIVNKEEAEMLLDKEIKGDLKEAMRELRSLGPQIVVITDGDKGAYAYDGRRLYRTRPLPAHPIEKTGAGDSFSTALVAALVYDKPLNEALLWGAANAASVIEAIGPQDGLLTRVQLAKRLKRRKRA